MTMNCHFYGSFLWQLGLTTRWMMTCAFVWFGLTLFVEQHIRTVRTIANNVTFHSLSPFQRGENGQLLDRQKKIQRFIRWIRNRVMTSMTRMKSLSVFIHLIKMSINPISLSFDDNSFDTFKTVQWDGAHWNWQGPFKSKGQCCKLRRYSGNTHLMGEKSLVKASPNGTLSNAYIQNAKFKRNIYFFWIWVECLATSIFKTFDYKWLLLHVCQRFSWMSFKSKYFKFSCLIDIKIFYFRI